jgi:hypothetical protein
MIYRLNRAGASAQMRAHHRCAQRGSGSPPIQWRHRPTRATRPRAPPLCKRGERVARKDRAAPRACVVRGRQRGRVLLRRRAGGRSTSDGRRTRGARLSCTGATRRCASGAKHAGTVRLRTCRSRRVARARSLGAGVGRGRGGDERDGRGRNGHGYIWRSEGGVQRTPTALSATCGAVVVEADSALGTAGVTQ